MLQEELHSQAPDDDRSAGDLSLVRGQLLAPFVALDGSETVRHENALAVERTESGYRVGLAVVNPGALPVFSDIFLSKCGSRAEWEALRKASYVRPLDSRAKLGYSDEQPTPSLVAIIDLSGPDLTVSSCRLALDPGVQVAQRSFGELPPLMPPHVPDSAVDVSLVAAAQLGLALYAQRRQRGDVVFADVKQGLLLQPDGSWELHKPDDFLGRIVTQEITCKVLEGVALLAASHNIPLIYQGCSKAAPALSQLLGEKLRDGLIKSRHDIDQHLVDANAHRIRLLHRREYSPNPIPHAGLHLSAYLRMSAPLREFVDCVNLQQLIRFTQGEPPLYEGGEIEQFIAETAQRQRERVRRKGDRKYSPLVDDGLKILREDGEMSPTRLRSFVADCRDAGNLPSELIEYLMHGMETDPAATSPVLASLIFSRFIGSSRDLRGAAQWIVLNRPDLIEGLIACAMENGSLSTHIAKTTRITQGGVAESLWCVDGRLYPSQLFVARPRRFDADLELTRVQRIQFAKLCGAKYGWESPNKGRSELFPQIRGLEFELNRRGERYELGVHAHRIQGGLTEYVLTVSSDLRMPEAIRYQGVHRSDDWFVAVEAAAGQIVARLAQDSAVEGQKASSDDEMDPSISQAS
jgi:hypothetical protein